MTLPDERFRAVLATEQFLYKLLQPKYTPGVPKKIREEARSLLRHYPSGIAMMVAAEAAPGVFQSDVNIDPLYKMVKQYDNEKKGSDI